MAERSLRGHLLVAAPKLVDPNFYRAVVLVLDHDEEGGLGVVVNRPSDTSVAETLPGWEEVAGEPRRVFVGGPVQPEAAVCLAHPLADAEPPDGSQTLLDWVSSIDLERDPELVRPAVQSLRVFAGYAGWAPGQLEAEVASDDWFVLDALPADVFGPHPEDLWRRVLRREGGNLRLVAEFPPHPSLN